MHSAVRVQKYFVMDSLNRGISQVLGSHRDNGQDAYSELFLIIGSSLAGKSTYNSLSDNVDCLWSDLEAMSTIKYQYTAHIYSL